MTDVLEKSCNDVNMTEFKIKVDVFEKTSNSVQVDDLIEVSSAAWMTPSPSPILCGPEKIKVLPKVSKKLISNPDACKALYRSVPPVRNHFRVIRKIGSGTFSNVYLAKLRSLGDKSPEFALKHIFSISHPKRIANEIKCLHEIGGDHHVVGIESCIRYNGEIVIVMPYQSHSDFMELMKKMNLENVRVYMRQLLTALCRVHQHNVIHRDVKPNNFLFDLDTEESCLVDFGLSQYISNNGKISDSFSSDKSPPLEKIPDNKISGATSNVSTSAPPNRKRSAVSPPKAKRRCLAELQVNNVPTSTAKKPLFVEKKLLEMKNKKLGRFEHSCNAENIKLLKTNLKPAFEEKMKFLSLASPTTLLDSSKLTRRGSNTTIADIFPSIRKYTRSRSRSNLANRHKKKVNEKSCSCFGRLTVCYKCLARPSANASRAGTAGFRPPEVLLRYPSQTTAVDIWSAGVIFLTLLCGRCPFFRPCDDLDSLAQLVLIFGSKKLQEVAKLLGRKLTCSQQCSGYDLRGIVSTLRVANHCEGPKLRNSPKRRNHVDGESPRKSSQSNPNSHTGFDAVDIPDSAFELLKRMLDPNPHNRITALAALYHDFLITDEKKVFVSPFKSPLKVKTALQK